MTMDSYTDSSDSDFYDFDNENVNCSPFPDECQNEIEGIERFNGCFFYRYGACPVFYPGSLQNACQEAFSSRLIKEHCPVLVYIHNDKSISSNIFCSNIFCSTIIIDYLLNNYIVWPWDITLESNRNRLIQFWSEIFPDQSFGDLSVEQCPMFIGIMRHDAAKDRWLQKFGYKFTSLLEGGRLTRTEELLTRDTVLRELIIFKEKCDDNEKNLSFNMMSKIGFSKNIALEIAKYLSLNDAVNVFSDSILSYLHKDRIQVHISEYSDAFINMIRQKINPEQIASLSLDASKYWSETNLRSLDIFADVISLTLLNPSSIDQVNQYQRYFPNMICLSLRYDNEINLNILAYSLQCLPHRIRRFKIQCAGVQCTHYNTDQLNDVCEQNRTIKYFLFDVGHFPIPSINECFQQQKSCFLTSIIYFIKHMCRIQYVGLIINTYNVNEVLDMNEWKNLIDNCSYLKKVTVETLKTMSSGKQVIQKALEIQKIAHDRE